jgi:type II secretory pathway predicted ATPase ExeA
MLKLGEVLRAARVSQAELARELGLGKSTVTALIRHGQWPKTRPTDELREEIIELLSQWKLDFSGVFDEVAEPDGSPDRPGGIALASRGDVGRSKQQQENQMLLRKQSLSPAARRHFGLLRDPFGEDVSDPDDVFVSPDIRYVHEAMFQTARHGGFMAIVGESGAGKTTLRRDLIDRIGREDLPIVVIEPYVLGMEDNDAKGKTMKASSIADAIISSIAPLENPRRTMEAKSRQLHRLLKDSRKAGYAHCLIIEEAHGLSLPTIKHLKRFFELEDGFRKLLSIILIGQPELRTKLSERNPEVREVVQRCEVVELPPLDSRLEEYLGFKLSRVGADLNALFDASGLDAVRQKLTFSRAPPGKGRGEAISLLYPLAVGNLVSAAMNLAAELGLPKVNGDLVREV